MKANRKQKWGNAMTKPEENSAGEGTLGLAVFGKKISKSGPTKTCKTALFFIGATYRI